MCTQFYLLLRFLVQTLPFSRFHLYLKLKNKSFTCHNHHPIFNHSATLELV
nr:MAG TPA: hypothetical protein [Caudoviricetes sp.]